jgi:hypothetical protein
MSSFDEVFRGQAAEKQAAVQAAEAQRRSEADAVLARAVAAVPLVRQMFDDFLRAVNGRVQPKRYDVFLPKRFKRGSTLSPKGYLLHKYNSFGSVLEVVPVFVELEVAVPHLSPAAW